jgi:hypothetical protein
VLTGPDAMAAHALARAMPPVGRAEQAGVAGPAARTGPDPGVLVEDALAVLVDAAVRDRLAGAGAPLDLLPARRGRRPTRPSAVQAWLGALASGDGAFEAEPGELGALRAALAPWDALGVLGTEPVGAARATFRLTEQVPLYDPADPDPAAPDVVWRLEFLLRSTADPSLLVPAEHIWRAPDGLRRWIDAPQELLLAELARASVVYPELAGGGGGPPAGAPRGGHPGGRPAPPVRRRSSWTPRAPTGFWPRLPAGSTRPASACCCPPGGGPRAGWVWRCRRTPRRPRRPSPGVG